MVCLTCYMSTVSSKTPWTNIKTKSCISLELLKHKKILINKNYGAVKFIITWGIGITLNVFGNSYYSFALSVSIPFHHYNEFFRYVSLGDFKISTAPKPPFSLKWLQDYILRLFFFFPEGGPHIVLGFDIVQKCSAAFLVWIFRFSL